MAIRDAFLIEPRMRRILSCCLHLWRCPRGSPTCPRIWKSRWGGRPDLRIESPSRIPRLKANLGGPRGRHPQRSTRHSGQRRSDKAYPEGKLPFPDGTIIARLAWSYDPLKESEKAFGRLQ